MNFAAASGDLTIDGLTITGGVTSGSADGAGILFTSDGTVTVNNSTIIGNRSGDDGGGVYVIRGNVSVDNTSIIGNTARDFGGGMNFSDGVLTLTESTISGNTATTGFGGGLNLGSFTATITSSTINGNSTPNGGGGGIRSLLSEELTVIDTTISGNTAGGSSFGGGGLFLGVNSASTISIINSTIVQNKSSVGPGGVFTESPLTVANSIIADNTSNGVSSDLVRDVNFFDPDVTINHSLIGNADGIGTTFGNVGNLTGTTSNPLDPVLGELADNGGPTLTHALLPGSPAIDAGSNGLAVDQDGVALPFDQRGEGFARIVDGIVDIGAFESQVETVAPTVESIVINNGDDQRSMVNQVTVNFSEVVNVSSCDFLLENLDDGTTITPIVSTQNINGRTIATLTFSGTGIVGGSLADGNFRLTVLDTVADASGNTLDTDGTSGDNATDDFFRLYGDASGDGSVGLQDFASFRSVFGGESEALDADGDGVVGLTDFAAFRSNFGKSL